MLVPPPSRAADLSGRGHFARDDRDHILTAALLHDVG